MELVGNKRDTNKKEAAQLFGLIQTLTNACQNHKNDRIKDAFHNNLRGAIPKSNPPELADLQDFQTALTNFKTVVDSQ